MAAPFYSFVKSLPLPGAWIEIFCMAAPFYSFVKSLPLPGAWIEIDAEIAVGPFKSGRSLYRERGLKLRILRLAF